MDYTCHEKEWLRRNIFSPSKGTGVEYNYLNLPKRVTFGGDGEVRYTYDAEDNKRLKDGIPAATKWYYGIQLSG